MQLYANVVGRVKPVNGLKLLLKDTLLLNCRSAEFYFPESYIDSLEKVKSLCNIYDKKVSTTAETRQLQLPSSQ
jgi:hypothetical protein